MVAWAPTGDVNSGMPDEAFVFPTIFRHRFEVWTQYLGVVDTDSSHPDTWDFLATLAAMPHVKTIVEAGTYRGHGTFAMAEAVAMHRKMDAHIWTADVEDHGATDVLAATGLFPYVTFFHGRFEAMLATVPTPIDVAFIDASEEATPHLRLDYVNQVMPRLAPHGVIVVDDSTNDEWPGAKVLRTHANLYLPIGHGLTIFQGFRE